jgi:hypothetical protein
MPDMDLEPTQNQNKKKKENFVSRRKLGELLIESGLLSADQIEGALEVQKRTGKRLGEVLVEMKVISEEEIAFALAMQLKIPFVDLTDYTIQARCFYG